MVYPDGSYTIDLVSYGKSIGYQYHLITDYQNEEDKENSAIFDRMTINPFISTYNQILAIIQGKYYGGI